MTENIIAIIPARGGSKRIPRKNCKDFCGAPMISWAIKAALDSDVFKRVIVSTDSQEIKTVSEAYGAEVPFERPQELSDDFTIAPKVVKHAVEWLIEEGDTPTLVCTIYPTSPLLEPIDLVKAKDLYYESGAEIVFSGTEMPFPIQRAFRLNDANRVSMFDKQHYATRSQDLETAYQDAGQFYFSNVRALLDEEPVFSEIAALYILPRYKVVDIDTPEDWDMAEIMFKLTQSLQQKHSSNI